MYSPICFSSESSSGDTIQWIIHDTWVCIVLKNASHLHLYVQDIVVIEADGLFDIDPIYALLMTKTLLKTLVVYILSSIQHSVVYTT